MNWALDYVRNLMQHCQVILMNVMTMTPHKTCLILAAAAGLVSCTSQDAVLSGDLPPPIKRNTSTIAPSSDSGLFAPGDSLELFVKEDATLNSSYPVREGGYIVIPRAGRINVAGLSRNDAELKVKQVLQQTQLTEATVLVERTSKSAALLAAGGHSPATPKIMIYVTGAVFKPGTHNIPLPEGKNLGVYEALLITGGLARLAQDQRVEVIRSDETGRRHRALIDVRKIRQGLAADPAVAEGDIIHVPEKVFGF
jgi:protein involved in polysaccharide export with SLBB domain